MTNEQIDELLSEIGRAPLKTCKEEHVLLKAVKEKGTDCNEMKRLEAANMRFIVSLANKYQHRGLNLEELIEAATASLRNAAQNYYLDPDIKFITYAVNQMHQSIEGLITLNCIKNEKGGNTMGE